MSRRRKSARFRRRRPAAVTFICMNHATKISRTALALWARILAAVPASRLMLLATPYDGQRAEVLAFFAAQGIAGERIEQVGEAPIATYLARYLRADIALDSLPCAGGTTTCDALWMGVPVVTLVGDRPFSRSGASLLRNAGLTELIARTPDEYVRAAVDLAADRARLAGLRAGLRDRLRASPLLDAGRLRSRRRGRVRCRCGNAPSPRHAHECRCRSRPGATDAAIAGASRRIQALRQAAGPAGAHRQSAGRGLARPSRPRSRSRRSGHRRTRGRRIGRRVGLRQVDARTDRRRHAAADQRASGAGAALRLSDQPPADGAPAAAQDADDLPGSVRIAEPAPARRRHRRRSAGRARPDRAAAAGRIRRPAAQSRRPGPDA